MKFLARHVEQLTVFVLLILADGVLWPPDVYLAGNQAQLWSKDPYSTLFNAMLLAFLAVASAANLRTVLPALRAAWPMLPVFALAYLSAFWSPAPDIVVVHCTKALAVALLGVYVLSRDGMPGLVSLLVKVNLVAVAACFLVAVVSPGLQFSTELGYSHVWRGAFSDKNELGMNVAIGVIIAIYAFRNGYGPRLLSAIAIPANLSLLYLSDSVTSLIVLLAAGYVAVVGRTLRRRDGIGITSGLGLILIGLLGAVVLAGTFDELLAALARNPTLTGRTEIWRAVLPFVTNRFWLGHGFDSFWRPEGVEANQVWAVLQWRAPSAHNLWLQTLLDLGAVGCGLLAVAWLALFWRALRLLFGVRPTHAVFGLVLLVAMLVDNLTEYSFFTFPFLALFPALLAEFGQELAAGRISSRTREAAFAGPYAGANLSLSPRS